jgi:hypothetical protein
MCFCCRGASSYISTLSALSAPSVTSPSPLGSSLFRHLVDLSHLKNKELDEVESALDFFTTPHTRPSQKRISNDQTDDTSSSSSSTADGKPASDVLARVLPQKDPNVFDIDSLR